MENQQSMSYEYSPVMEGNNEMTDQYLLMNDDGTVIRNGQVQYVADLSGTDSISLIGDYQKCTTIYDSSLQHCYNNTVEVVDHSSSHAALSRGYLFDGSTNFEIIDQISSNHAEENETVTTGNLMQVTLSEEQCHLLKKKGRVLLEIDDKVYLLDALGLHDITSHLDTVELLKNEFCANQTEMEQVISIEENPKSAALVGLETTYIEEAQVSGSGFSEAIVIDVASLPSYLCQNAEANERTCDKDMTEKNTNHDTQLTKDITKSTRNKEYISSVEKALIYSERKEKVIKLQVDFNADDIPDRMFVGYNKRGNKIFAKVTNVQRVVNKNKLDLSNKSDKSNLAPETNKEVGGVPPEIQNLLSSGSWQASTSHEDVSRASRVVEALLAKPNVKPLLTGQQIIVTKMTISSKYAHTRQSRIIGSVVEGQVVRTDSGDDSWAFVLYRSTFSNETNKDNRDEEFNCTHVHVTETKLGCQSPTTTVTVLRTRLSKQTSKIKSVHACSACGTTYSDENELLSHQEMCQQDISQNIDNEQTMGRSETTRYNCSYCKKIFQRPINLHRHITTKCLAKIRKTTVTSQPEVNNKGKFLCNMCPSSYNYSSTLLRHILSEHLKETNN